MKSVLIVIFIFASAFLNAQDIIMYKNGEKISAKVLEITPELVKYKKYNKQEGPTYSIYKSDIIQITYEDGSVESFFAKPTISNSEKNVEEINVDVLIDPLDNKSYKVILIGNQVWMAENLNTSKFNDGTPIPLVTDKKSWSESTTPGYCWYDNQNQNSSTYGALYNWYAVNTGKLCPQGWHVPSDTEWTILLTYLGGYSLAGGKLKESGTTHWKRPNTDATNETSFTGLPGGCRYYNNGNFHYIGESGYWWSSTEDGTNNAWCRALSYSYNQVRAINSFDYKQSGFSVRCLKD